MSGKSGILNHIPKKVVLVTFKNIENFQDTKSSIEISNFFNSSVIDCSKQGFWRKK